MQGCIPTHSFDIIGLRHDPLAACTLCYIVTIRVTKMTYPVDISDYHISSGTSSLVSGTTRPELDKNMAWDNKIRVPMDSIDVAEGQSEKQIRSLRTKLFQWQTYTAAVCLIARFTLLYHWVRSTSLGLQLDFDPASIVPCTFLLLEFAFTLYRLFPQHVEAIQFGPKADFRPRLRLTGTQAPKVDVLIFYCGEGVHILLDTVKAACSSDYPPDGFRVTVLDDSDTASDPIRALQPRFPNLFYTARRGRDRAWHKAGNINHGLDFVASLPGGANELVAGLDVDMMPEKDWLRRMVPHFRLNPNMGMVCSNQRFYNVPPGDPLGQLLQMDQMQSVRQLRRDFGNAALGTGTGWMASRIAMDSNGGFSTGGIAEGYLTSQDLRAAGWTVVLLNEDIQWGLLPESLNEHLKQKQRWFTAVLSFIQAQGNNPGRPKPRLQGAIADMSITAYVLVLNSCYFVMPVLVLSGYPFLNIDDPTQLKTMILLGFVDFVAQSTHGFLESWTTDFTIYSWHEMSHLWHAPLYVAPLLRRWFPGLTAITIGRASKLSTGISAANQSSEDRYTSRWKRLQIVCTETNVFPHLFVLGTCIAGVMLFCSIIVHHMQVNNNNIPWRYIITHAGYPPALFFWSSALRNSCTPFWYAIFVPARKPREEYLMRDEKSGVACPRPEAKDQRHRRVQEWHLLLSLAYFMAVLVLSQNM
ncbi:MAG: hypothetical protein Q9174_006437 [Haloplaca sp. 1 TL-2023]